MRASWAAGPLLESEAEFLLDVGCSPEHVLALARDPNRRADGEVLCSFVTAEGKCVIVTDYMGGTLRVVGDSTELYA